ncbi:hypothetical protein [Niastella caeni]|nr:hypothetical protein [Niastella caeni]
MIIIVNWWDCYSAFAMASAGDAGLTGKKEDLSFTVNLFRDMLALQHK